MEIIPIADRVLPDQRAHSIDFICLKPKRLQVREIPVGFPHRFIDRDSATISGNCVLLSTHRLERMAKTVVQLRMSRKTLGQKSISLNRCLIITHHDFD